MVSFPQAHNNTLLYKLRKGHGFQFSSFALLLFLYLGTLYRSLLISFVLIPISGKFILHLDKFAQKMIYTKIYKFVYKIILFIIFKAMDK